MNTTPNSDASSSENLSEEERTAVRERAAESKSATRRSRTADKAAADERDVLTKIAEMPQPDRSLAERVHTLVTTAAPELSPKLWYGQPAYAKNGKVLCFFRSAQKDKARYSTLGFTEEAALDHDTGLWPTSYALTETSPAAGASISELVERAVG